MAAEINDVFKMRPLLIKSAGGVFEVTVDHQLLYSKKETGAFPENSDIIKAIKDKL